MEACKREEIIAPLKHGRKFVVGGNWKMNGSRQFIDGFLPDIIQTPIANDVEVFIAPPAVYLASVVDKLKGSKVNVSGQNCSQHESGAYTGELSGAMLIDVGASHVIIGHSERRHIYKETDEVIAAKVATAQKANLVVVACVGELIEEREAGLTNEVVFKQLSAILNVTKDFSKLIIAYEPVWAIGTGKVATPEEAQATHHDIRNYVRDQFNNEVAQSLRILYGGSVKASNCEEIGIQPDVDGFLIGGASLLADFAKIINLSANFKQ